MFQSSLKTIYQKNNGENSAYVRNVLKEHIQYYLLHFISQSVWAKRFVFKGGTCLRIFFDLPRLSEDLDFDVLEYETFNMSTFMKELKTHFISKLKFDKIALKLSNNKRTLYVKFPILRDLGIKISPHESNILYVRIDIVPVVGSQYATELSIKSTNDFSLLITRYSLPDLFSGKIAAIIKREAFEGTIKKERMKGRDYYDLLWFLEKKVTPNWKYLTELTSLNKDFVLKSLRQKIEKVNPSELNADLMPFFQDTVFVKSFSQNIGALYSTYVKNIE